MLRVPSSDLSSDETLTQAANIIKTANKDHKLLLILGSQINIYDLPDFVSYRQQLSTEARKLQSIKKVEKKLFAKYERARIVSSNCLPPINLLCITRLIRKGIVDSIITTNYDCSLLETVKRFGGPYTCVQNPPLPGEGFQDTWDKDGYISPYPPKDNEIPVWKIHGDIGFVRMDECQHIFKLPKFSITLPQLDTSVEHPCCHWSVLKNGSTKYNYDPTLFREHAATRYHHHVDFGATRDLFTIERQAAAKQLEEHVKKGNPIIIIGISFNVNFGEDLTEILNKLPSGSDIVYIVASSKPIDESSNELIGAFKNSGRKYILVNEITDRKRIDDALIEILVRAGDTGLDEEYTQWKTGGLWWEKSEE
jgi:hypothetical protein